VRYLHPFFVQAEDIIITLMLVTSNNGDGIVKVTLNRENKLNAMNQQFWIEINNCFASLAKDSSCRVILLNGNGRVFSAGIDLHDNGISVSEKEDTARTAYNFINQVKEMQQSFTAIEKCPQPVIACVDGACIGAGVDMICACDIRLCSRNSWFSIKEVDIGLAADVGTLQRMPKLIGNDSIMRELVYTGRRFNADEAQNIGFIGNIYDSRENLMTAALKIAASIASKSPVAIAGSKHNLIYSRDHSVTESLEYMATWNASMIQTQDIMESMEARLEKRPPVFSKL